MVDHLLGVVGNYVHSLALGAVAPIQGMSRHPDVAAAFAQKPFSFGSGLHQFELIALSAIGTSDDV